MDNKTDAMNYLVFDENLFNALIVSGLKNVYYSAMDYSIFHIENDEFLSNITVFYNKSLSESDLLEKPLTILYSKCPVEICGLYAAVSFFYNKEIPIYITSPPYIKDRRNIISYSDCGPEEIIDLMRFNRVYLSDSKKINIHNEWNKILQEESNLRIWSKNNLVNVEDDYFDDDIKEILKKQRSEIGSNKITDIHLSLRSKYHIGLNPKYIAWRIFNILSQDNY